MNDLSKLDKNGKLQYLAYCLKSVEELWAQGLLNGGELDIRIFGYGTRHPNFYAQFADAVINYANGPSDDLLSVIEDSYTTLTSIDTSKKVDDANSASINLLIELANKIFEYVKSDVKADIAQLKSIEQLSTEILDPKNFGDQWRVKIKNLQRKEIERLLGGK